MTPDLPKTLLDIGTIYHEPQVEEYSRGREIFARFPDAERIEVASHWNIAGLHGNEGSAAQWLQIKRGVLVLGTRKALQMEANGRSSDFIAPSSANGCASACAYCYVPRRKGFANPITTFVNIEKINTYIAKHAEKQGIKFIETPADDDLWVYEIGCNSDTSIDAAISDNVRDMVALFTTIPNAKATFATKWVNRAVLDYDPQRKTRIRFSLMPHAMSRLVDIRTSSISERIAAMNDFYDAGYEVDVNFSPVIIEEDFLERYDELFDEINDVVRSDVREKLVAEIIFLTHNAPMHNLNLQWHPKAEAALWKPELQEGKTSQSGGTNVRYKVSLKTPLISQFCERLQAKLPHCKIRYAF
jgi:spore photoproduct lyase